MIFTRLWKFVTIRGELKMFTINNKFEIDENCFAVVERTVNKVCEVCESEYITKAKLIVPVTIVSLKAKVFTTIKGDKNISISYKVRAINPHTKVKTRPEHLLFKAKEDAEKYITDIHKQGV